jgi:hypothetical protein
MSRVEIPPAAAQITICGALSKDAIASLVEVAMGAGAALIVQPRSALDVIEAEPERQKALPAARPVAARSMTPRARPGAAVVPVPDSVRRALAGGPLPVNAFLESAGMSRYDAHRLVASGAIVAFGATVGRRYALPGHSAKEAP